MAKLSKRLEHIYKLVTPGNTVADVGCDHGFLSIALVEDGIAPSAIAMDLREGPLERARQHIAEAGLSDAIETRLSDGVTKLAVGEAKAIVITGMGGNVIRHIFECGYDVMHEAKEIILGPQSELFELREFLSAAGYRILAEDMVEEDGKYYQLIRLSYIGEPVILTDAEYTYGPCLIADHHPVLKDFLQHEEEVNRDILQELPDTAAQRIEVITGRIEMIRSVLEEMK